MEYSRKKSDQNRIKWLGLSTLIGLMALAGGFAYGSYYVVYYFEGKLEADEFLSISQLLERSSLKSMEQKINALQAVSELLSMACPEPSTWPNCSVPLNSYLNITDPLIEMGDLRTVAFAPIIRPDQVAEFEAFAYNTFESNGYPTMGISSFGRGISAVNSTTGERYHDTTGPFLNNDFQILTPVIQVGNLKENLPAIMFNLYSQQFRISAIDFMIKCFHNGHRGKSCTSITDVIHLVQDVDFRPAVLVIFPVTASGDRNRLVGLCYGVLNWDTVLSNVFPEFVTGIDVVLTGGQSACTFSISGGVASLKSLGDTHDKSRRGFHFHIPFFAGSVVYELAVFQTKEYEARFHSDLPVYAMLAAIGIVLLTSSVFFIYDYKMKRAAQARELVLNTKRLFVRFISHEIRTPMNIVHLGLNLLAKEIVSFMSRLSEVGSADLREILDHLEDWVKLSNEIEESSDAAILVLNDLINYDKISLGGMSIETKPINVWKIINRTVKPFLVQARERNINLVVNLQVKDQLIPQEKRSAISKLKVMGDEIKISQVLRNIVSNALKFTNTGGDVIVTAVYIENGLPLADMTSLLSGNSFTKTGSILISVKDSGAGISEEDQKNLFKEGIQFRANQLQAGGGSGLGLWISKGVVVLHHGTISAESGGEGKGTTFHVELPLGHYLSEDDEDDDITEDDNVISLRKIAKVDKSSNSLNDGVSEKLGKRKQTILCVDDSAPSRKITCRMLGFNGYTCYEACDGEHCLKVFQSLSDEGIFIDFVLMDFEMPNMNGPTATRKLIDLGCTCPIIGVTGNVLQQDRDVFFENGAVEVLAKPLSVSLLQKIFVKLASKEASTTNADTSIDDKLSCMADVVSLPKLNALEIQHQI